MHESLFGTFGDSKTIKTRQLVEEAACATLFLDNTSHSKRHKCLHHLHVFVLEQYLAYHAFLFYFSLCFGYSCIQISGVGTRQDAKDTTTTGSQRAQ